MKTYLSTIAWLFLFSTPFVLPATVSSPEIIVQEINPHIKDNIARKISVKITSEENGGSGVIIAQQDNTYLVLTNAHVLRNGSTFNIQTRDGITHQAKPVANGIETDDDLALLEFSSDNSYQTATINSAAKPLPEQDILAVGYDAATGKLVVEEGKIERVADRSFKDGYSIGYSNNIVQGMSGGAILNTNGEVIGINGKSAFPIVNTGYVYQDGSEPTAEEIRQYRQLSWGLSLNSFLSQLNSEIITSYNLPLPETTAEIENTQLTGWLGELEEKAKQITVRIDSSSGANGSGIIVAKENNNYAVLTADHVVCEKNNDYECQNAIYEIIAPDGRKYPIEASNIKRQEGVDLAVVRFSSDRDYQVAELSNNTVKDDDPVFVAGYPDLSNKAEPKWLFSLGYGLSKEKGVLQVNDSSLSVDDSKLTKGQNSLAGGYELVYTSITYGGMSGGAVLDKDGRVIGIHGLTEGQDAINRSNGNVRKIQLGYSLGIPSDTFFKLKDKFKIKQLSTQNSLVTSLTSQERISFEAAILERKIPEGNTDDEWIERGSQLWRLKRDSEALMAFDRAITQNSDLKYLAYYGKALALINLQQHDSALESLKEGIKFNRNFVPNLKLQSSLFISSNNLQSALDTIDRIISLNSKMPDESYRIANLYKNKGQILARLQKYSEAEIEYNKAIKITPHSSFYYDLHIIYAYQQKWKLALENYNKAISFNEKSAKNYYIKGFLYGQQQKWELALENYNRALSLDSSFAEVYVNRGNVYARQRQWVKALNDYNTAISLNRSSSEAYTNRGNIYAYQKRWEKALDDYDKAISLDRSLPEVFLNRCIANAHSSKQVRALSDYITGYTILANNPYYKRAILSNDKSNSISFGINVRLPRKTVELSEISIEQPNKNYYLDDDFVYFNANESFDMNLLLPQQKKIVNSLYSLNFNLFEWQATGGVSLVSERNNYDYFFIDVDPQNQEWRKTLLN